MHLSMYFNLFVYIYIYAVKLLISIYILYVCLNNMSWCPNEMWWWRDYTLWIPCNLTMALYWLVADLLNRSRLFHGEGKTRVYEEYTVTITDFPTRGPILDSHRLIEPPCSCLLQWYPPKATMLYILVNFPVNFHRLTSLTSSLVLQIPSFGRRSDPDFHQPPTFPRMVSTGPHLFIILFCRHLPWSSWIRRKQNDRGKKHKRRIKKFTEKTVKFMDLKMFNENYERKSLQFLHVLRIEETSINNVHQFSCPFQANIHSLCFVLELNLQNEVPTGISQKLKRHVQGV